MIQFFYIYLKHFYLVNLYFQICV